MTITAMIALFRTKVGFIVKYLENELSEVFITNTTYHLHPFRVFRVFRCLGSNYSLLHRKTLKTLNFDSR